MHLLHGAVVQLEKGDILGHEFCGVVESMGNAVANGLKVGDRVVASFQIACGDVSYLLSVKMADINSISATIVSKSCRLSVSAQTAIPWKTACSESIIDQHLYSATNRL